MSRVCSQCQSRKSYEEYSNNQISKRDGVSRCRGCVAGYRCQECQKSFKQPNHLKMHMQIHRPRSVACPICCEERFRSDANAVQHIEGGFCSGCHDGPDLQDKLHQFAASRRAMKQYLSYNNPDFPYLCCCSRPSKSYKHLGQLLQHLDNKHSLHPLRIQFFKLSC